MNELAALFVLSPSRTSLTSSRCLQARPDPFYSPWAAGCLPPAFRHSAHASLCFASGLDLGRPAARQSSGTFWRQTISHMLLGACWCVAVSVPPHGAAMARCSACAAFVGAAAAGAAKRVQEGRVPPAVLVRTFVSGCAERAWCSCGQVAVRSLSL